jgi:hypothetical protein
MRHRDIWLLRICRASKFIFRLPETAPIAYTGKTSLQKTKFGKA